MIDVKLIKKPKNVPSISMGKGNSGITTVNPMQDMIYPVDINGNRVDWDSSDIFAIKSVKGFYSDEFVSAKGMKSGGGSGAGVSQLRMLEDVTLTEPVAGQALYYDGAKWVNHVIDIPSLEGYATEQWVKDQKYLDTHQSIHTLSFESGTFIPASFTANSSPALVKIPSTTSHISEGTNLYFTNTRAQSALAATVTAINSAIALKLDTTTFEGFKSSYDTWKATVDTFMTMFTLEGTGNNQKIKANFGLYTEQFLSARGMNPEGGSGGGATELRMLDDVNITNAANGQALVYDGMKWVNRKAGLDTAELATYLSTNSYAKKSDIPSLTGYATQTWVNQQGFLTGVAWGDVTGKPAWIGGAKPSYAFSEITGRPTTLAGYGITDAATSSALTAHTGDATAHITADERTAWNAKLDTSTYDTFKSGYDTWKSAIDAFKTTFESIFAKESDGVGGYRIKAKYGLYTDQFLSARGENSNGSSGGGNFNLMRTWSTAQNNPNTNHALGANLGWELKQRIDNLPTTSVNPYALTIQKNGTSLGTYDGSEAKTINISDVASAATLSSHTGNSTIHITAAERTKWNAAATNLSTILGSDASAVIDKWDEIVAFLDTYTEADTLANLLGNKADKATKITAGTGLTGSGTLASDVTLALDASGVTAGTYPKVTVDVYGRVTAGATLVASDIPTLAISKITGLQTALDGKVAKSGDTMSGLLTLNGGAKVTSGQKLIIGECEITWDAANGGLKFSKGIYSDSFVSARGLNADGGASGGGLIQTVYGSSDLSKTFADTTLTDTFNAYTIKYIHTRLQTVEGKYVTKDTAQTITDIKTFKAETRFTNTNGTYTDPLSNVACAIKAAGKIAASDNMYALAFIKSGGTSSQFLKADGSVDSNTYLTTGTASSTYVKKSGDTMTGTLILNSTLNIATAKGNIVANISTDTFFGPATASDGLFSLGRNSARWSNTYSVLGNFSGQITSSVSTGTSPFAVTSTTVNTNLNADLLDGCHAGYANGNVAVLCNFPSYATLVSQGYMEADTTRDTWLYLKGLLRWAGATHQGNILIGAIAPNSTGLVHLHVYASGLGADGAGAETGGADARMPRHCSGVFFALGGAHFTFGSNNGVWYQSGRFIGNADTSTRLLTGRSLWGNDFDGTADVSGDIIFPNSGTTTRQVRFMVGTNDYGRIAAGATAANAGWMEIASADDGNEPIYARQYTGIFTTIKRTATLLDSSGNTSFPGQLTAASLKIGECTITYENGGLHIDKGIYSDSFVSARGVNSGGTGNSGGGLIQNVYGVGSLGGSFSDTTLTDTFNAFTINHINTRLKALEAQNRVIIGTDGVSEMGRYIDFHTANYGTNTTQDYTARIDAGTANTKRVLTLPSTAGTLATQEWVTAKNYLTSHQSLANYVTLNSEQTISGAKTFSNNIFLQRSETDGATRRVAGMDAGNSYLVFGDVDDLTVLRGSEIQFQNAVGWSAAKILNNGRIQASAFERTGARPRNS